MNKPIWSGHQKHVWSRTIKGHPPITVGLLSINQNTTYLKPPLTWCINIQPMYRGRGLKLFLSPLLISFCFRVLIVSYYSDFCSWKGIPTKINKQLDKKSIVHNVPIQL
jgi:hypothetical protein